MDPLPFVPGMEFSGTVQETGAGVSRIRVGDRVYGLAKRGALAEEIVVPDSELAPVPGRLSFAQAAAIPMNYLTAAFALTERAGLRPGETLLVLGAAGGTGTAAIKIGKMMEAHVIAAASTEEKRSLARAEGADSAIDYTDENWREALKSLTKGRAVDVIFDAVGGDISPIAFRTLGWRGRHLVVGFAAGRIPSLPFNIALLKGLRSWAWTALKSASGSRNYIPDFLHRSANGSTRAPLNRRRFRSFPSRNSMTRSKP
jgi:NADPH2:quinone reductase